MRRGVTCFLLLSLGIAFTSCQASIGKKKYRETETEQCRHTQVSGRYLVRFSDGSYKEVQYQSKEMLFTQFIEPNENRIDFVEPAYRLARSMDEAADGPVLESFVENWATNGVNAPFAWERGLFGEGVRIAVVDTGVDVAHPQLRGRIMVNYREDSQSGGQADEDDDGNGFVDDTYGWNFVNETGQIVDETGHGTHVAGIIASNHDGLGIKGIAPRAKILPVDFMDADGGTSTQAIRAMQYAISRGVDIINASWTTKDCSLGLERAFQDWEDENVLIVTAAGNSKSNLNFAPEYPPAFRLANHLSVGAIDFRGGLANFSNYGNDVQVYAPGDYIHSLEPASNSGPVLGYRRGTSMSAAFVSGQAAILLDADPSLSPRELRKIIIESSV